MYHLNLYSLPTKRNKNAKKLTLDRLNLQVRVLGTSLLEISNKCGVAEKKLTSFLIVRIH